MRTLGMIPGFKPPKGTVQPPRGFSSLPTHEELSARLKAWVEARTIADPWVKEPRLDVDVEEQHNALLNYNRTWGQDDV